MDSLRRRQSAFPVLIGDDRDTRFVALCESSSSCSDDDNSADEISSVKMQQRRRKMAGRSVSLRQTRFSKRMSHINAVNLLTELRNFQIKHLLSMISDWSFDVFALEKVSNGRALYHVTMELFRRHALIETFKLDVDKLEAFAETVQSWYHDHPYHSATHAADVAQAMHCYISQKQISDKMEPTEVLVAVLAAITHDLDHPGVNQAFLEATKHPLVDLHQHEAVLEKHHCKKAEEALDKTKLLSGALQSKVLEEMQSLILATDMSRQPEFLNELKKRVAEDSLNMSDYDDRHFILQIAMKCADISNPCRHWAACKQWSEKVCEEFFQQGDKERLQDLPISRLCNRYTDTIPKIQTGFIDFCVLPLFSEFEKCLHRSDMLAKQLSNLRSNRQMWQMRQEPAARPTNLLLTPVPADIDDAPPSPTETECWSPELPSLIDVLALSGRNSELEQLYNNSTAVSRQKLRRKQSLF